MAEEKMNQEDVFNTVKRVFIELFELEEDELTLDANLYEDLDIDSIDAVDLIVRLKEETDLKMSPEQYKEIRTLGDIVRTLCAMLDERAAHA